MILDKLLMFSEAQAVTASAASTDVIDLGPIDGTRRDIGVGYPLEFWANVNTTATAGGAATLNVQLQTSPDNSTDHAVRQRHVGASGIDCWKAPVFREGTGRCPALSAC